MTILLYEHFELEERTSKSLKVWKVWHIILCILIVVFGILNYTFLLSAKQLVDDNCIIYPQQLAFHMVEWVNDTETNKRREYSLVPKVSDNETAHVNNDKSLFENNAQEKAEPNDTETQESKNELHARDNNMTYFETTIIVDNVTVIIGNKTHRLALDTLRSVFGNSNDCQFTEYVPILSSVIGLVWLTLFIMCPSGGRVKSGLQQPWRILAPALLCALVMVGLVGHSFVLTTGGLHDFCAAFHNYTNDTTCSSASHFVSGGWEVAWGWGGRVSAARAAAAAAWASWACACALLLARCIAAPDFQLRRTAVRLVSDPHNKILPHLKKSPRRTPVSPHPPRDDASVKSEPTASTQLVTVSVEPEQESASPSLTITPPPDMDTNVTIEMTHSPADLQLGIKR